jgi:succinate dehydrogenase / fumarate reductase flavoprotein subunit
MLQTLYENCLKQRVNFFSEFFVTDLIMSGKSCAGVVAMDIGTGEIHVFHAKAVMLATGGYGRIYRITSNAHVGTGDGFAFVYNNGLPLEDMEFVQFHPTGLWKLGILISEAARGEGGILLNNKGERFMERYAPTVKDLAPRDMVSRAILTEIREGRGFKGADGTYYVHLDVSHLPKEVIDEKIPEITGFARTYLGVEPTKEPIPIQPTCHYAMGGIPTTVDAEVTRDKKNTKVPGLYAAGEVACVSVHGANRLGTNSLLDLIVFGRRGGKAIAEFIKGSEFAPLPQDSGEKTIATINKIMNSKGRERVGALRTELQEKMMEKVGIFRNEKDLKEMASEIKSLRERYNEIVIDDKGKVFNTDLMEAIELGNLIGTAEPIIYGALARQESRGAHSREDYPKRDDKKWLRHTLTYKATGKTREPRIDFKPVSITRFQPKERKY